MDFCYMVKMGPNGNFFLETVRRCRRSEIIHTPQYRNVLEIESESKLSFHIFLRIERRIKKLLFYFLHTENNFLGCNNIFLISKSIFLILYYYLCTKLKDKKIDFKIRKIFMQPKKLFSVCKK